MDRGKSRKKTPWSGGESLTETQKFLRTHYDNHYAERHRAVGDSGEAGMINAHVPAKCPFCSAVKFRKFGYTGSGVQRYKCGCGKTFLPTTGTIFDEHRISISEWMEYCLNLFRHVSITADSWSNKNAFATSRYWLQKLFLTLETVQHSVILRGKVWLDETFYTVRTPDIVRREDGTKLSGLSRNQICIGVATDKKNTVLFVIGTGKPSQKRVFEAFGKHIENGATLVHDKEQAHRKLVENLCLHSEAYASGDLKNLADEDNPMNPVNQVHRVLKKFLNAHSGFNRDDLQGYLNLFAFVSNPPVELLEKVEIVVDLAFQFPKLLRYRDFFPGIAGIRD